MYKVRLLYISVLEHLEHIEQLLPRSTCSKAHRFMLAAVVELECRV